MPGRLVSAPHPHPPQLPGVGQGEGSERRIRDAFRYQANYVGEVPGATPGNCGNYILHDLAMAKWEAKAFLKRPWKFAYPKARRVVAKGKVFFDA